MRYTPTTAQREQIVRLMHKAELDTRHITLMHKPVFSRAGLWSSTDLDQRVDTVLERLTFSDASKLIDALNQQVAAQ